MKRNLKPIPWAAGFLYFCGTVLYRLRFSVTEENTGTETIPDGPLLILCKHQSAHDIPLGYAAMKRLIQRRPWCLIKHILAHPLFCGFFLKIGGIPVNRRNPRQTMKDLLFARKILYNGEAIVIFPEQTRIPGKMGEGHVAGFRFITGKPKTPISTVCAGIIYKKGFPRRKVTIRFGTTRQFEKQNNAAMFLHECMQEIAQLSDMDYPFPAP